MLCRPNRLISEKSPYLQQHARNPVDWYPWGDEAFERARSEGKPIFLSIGYSTCHWCHVMERESFEDQETADLMNELFVNIKVDREERPDVDNVYMTASQVLTGGGGWPLSAWLAPDLRPYYVGTYFPPRPSHGRPAFRDALRQLHAAWTEQREKVVESAAAIMEAVTKSAVVVADPTAADVDPITLADRCFAQLERGYDPRNGGFSPAPKFPRPPMLEFLLRYGAYQENDLAVAMVLHTMRKMSDGGMYDQLGGGFARYSVDNEWRVPHFEKMLYDEGQLLAVYADAGRLSKHDWLEQRVAETILYLERDLRHESGAFYSAEDADSEGEEGTFYVWTEEELEGHLSADEFAVVRRYYGITPKGNFEHGKNVLHVSATPVAVAEGLGITEDAMLLHLRSAHERLLAIRSLRVRPHRDEKILVSWNGLAISGLAHAAAAFNQPAWLELARGSANALLDAMWIDGELMHRLKDGEARFAAYLEDYAFLAQGLIDLYEASFDLRYLKEATRMVERAGELFWDDEGAGYFMTSGDDPSILVRSKGDHDGAEPAGNSVMAMNLLRLGHLFDDETMLARAKRTIDLFTSRIAEHPVMMPLMVAAAMTAARAPRQIVIAASTDAADTERLIREVHGAYRPGTGLVLVPTDGADPWLLERVPTLAGMGMVDAEAVAYICENFVCQRPVREVGPILSTLG
jgi:uncharacterized protein YyaL (SSP411 family)